MSAKKRHEVSIRPKDLARMKTVAMSLGWIPLCFALSHFATAEKLETTSGTYKDAFRKAGEAGKPVMLFFWHDSYVDCKREWAQMEEIPDTMKKFVVYRINGEQNAPLVQQFQVTIFPTLIFLKPNGTEFYRQQTIMEDADRLRRELEMILDKGGPIPKSQKQREPPSDKTAKGVAEREAYEKAASNDLKAAMNQLNVGRTKEATKAFQQILAKYPGSKAAEQAQEQLEELEPTDR